MNLVNAVDNTNHEFLYRGTDAVDVFCKKIYEMRDEIKEKTQEKKEIEMTDQNKKMKLRLTALYVVINLRTHIRMKKKQRNTETTVILLVSIEVVLIAYVILSTVINILKYQYFFHHMKTYERRMMDI